MPAPFFLCFTIVFFFSLPVIRFLKKKSCDLFFFFEFHSTAWAHLQVKQARIHTAASKMSSAASWTLACAFGTQLYRYYLFFFFPSLFSRSLRQLRFANITASTPVSQRMARSGPFFPKRKKKARDPCCLSVFFFLNRGKSLARQLFSSHSPLSFSELLLF